MSSIFIQNLILPYPLTRTFNSKYSIITTTFTWSTTTTIITITTTSTIQYHYNYQVAACIPAIIIIFWYLSFNDVLVMIA